MDNGKIGLIIVAIGGFAGTGILLYFLNEKELITKPQLMLVIIAIVAISVILLELQTKFIRNLLKSKKGLGAKEELFVAQGVQAIKDYYNNFYHEKVKISHAIPLANSTVVVGELIRPDIEGNFTKVENFNIDLSKGLYAIANGDIQTYKYSGDDLYLQKKQKLISMQKKPETDFEAAISALGSIDENMAEAYKMKALMDMAKPPQSPTQPQTATQPTVVVQQQENVPWWKRNKAKKQLATEEEE